jgi:uncharacterized protein
MKLTTHLPITALFLATLLTGCGADKNPVVGAYEARIKTGDNEPRYVGVMVIQKDKIWADGQSVDVSSWKFEDSNAVATSPTGEQVMTFKVNKDEHVLSQVSANGDELILRKLFF